MTEIAHLAAATLRQVFALGLLRDLADLGLEPVQGTGVGPGQPGPEHAIARVADR